MLTVIVEDMLMTDQKAKYNIKAISNMIGIQPGTLRAWERRYNIIEPIRNESGHRLYSDEHVAILRWLLDKVNKGFTIGQAVGLLERGNVNLEAEVEAGHNSKLHTISSELKDSLLSFHEQRANQVLEEAFSLFSIERIVIDVISVVLVEIGDDWEKGEITIAHEHFASQYLRTRLGMIFNNLQIDPLLPKVITVCGPSERHELGLLIFSLFLRRKGFEVIYLGTGISINDLKMVLDEVKAKYLFLSCTLLDNINETLSVVKEIEQYDSQLNIGIGGNAIQLLSKRKKNEFSKNIVGVTKDEWNDWLKGTIHH